MLGWRPAGRRCSHQGNRDPGPPSVLPPAGIQAEWSLLYPLPTGSRAEHGFLPTSLPHPYYYKMVPEAGWHRLGPGFPCMARHSERSWSVRTGDSRLPLHFTQETKTV